MPHIVVTSSKDTEDLVAEKGFKDGLWQLLRPFGDHVSGKVVVRDSVGGSRAYDNFAVRFTKLGDGEERPAQDVEESRATIRPDGGLPPAFDCIRTGGDIGDIETVVDRHLEYAEQFSSSDAEDYLNAKHTPLNPYEMSPFYQLYLRKLLSGMPIVASETFSHPVACVIAISSRNPNPIEELRRLYEEATRGPKRLPAFVNGEYLRYYILVHDEETDDIGKSMGLFEQMKRHFGLHCHLLRLRSSRCVPTDDDSILLPISDWLSAGEEIAEIRVQDDQDDLEVTPPCIYESDATSINTFIREMVTQSVVPSMERCVATWNDQVASRRRGLTGRFMTLSKKWSVFGSSSPRTSGLGGGSGTGSNYDSMTGSYPPDAPEAIMRKLADYAFMLRDYKLAHGVYDLLRSDFNNDKAWRYHAGANEMGAITTLISSQSMTSKSRAETVDQMLETASYSYLTRCSAPYGALRCLALSMELLKIRGGSATDDAARWATKISELGMVGDVGDALFKERVAACYGARKGTGSGHWGARSRKSALWTLLASDKWLALGKYKQAQRRLFQVQSLYAQLPSGNGISKFALAREFVAGLKQELEAANRITENGEEDPSQDEKSEPVEEVAEELDTRSHRKSIIGAAMPTIGSLEAAPLNMVDADRGPLHFKDDSFQ